MVEMTFSLMRRNKKKVFVLMLLTIIFLIGVESKNFGIAEASDTWSPWEYDKNNDGAITMEEAVHAVNHYRWAELTREQAVEVMKIYFRVR